MQKMIAMFIIMVNCRNEAIVYTLTVCKALKYIFYIDPSAVLLGLYTRYAKTFTVGFSSCIAVGKFYEQVACFGVRTKCTLRHPAIP